MNTDNSSIALRLGYDESNYIHSSCVIYPGVRMGKGNYFGPGCTVGGPAEHRGAWEPVATGRVVIGDQNVFTGHVTIDSAMAQDIERDKSDPADKAFTLVGNQCFFMKHTHVGHDARVGNDCTVSVGAVIGGHCLIRHGVTLGVNSFIHQRQVIADYCMVGAGAVVDKKIETFPFNIYVGLPARFKGQNVVQEGKFTTEARQAIWNEFLDSQEHYFLSTGMKKCLE